MSWISQHWQTLTAAVIVAGTVLTFVVRAVRRRKGTGCGHGCGCGIKPRP